MPGQNEQVSMLRIRTEEKTFKSLADSILNMSVMSESDLAKRCALINSAKSFIDGQLRKNIDCGYMPLEIFMTPGELAWGRAKIVPSIKDWLSYNLDVFEKKSSGRMSR